MGTAEESWMLPIAIAGSTAQPGILVREESEKDAVAQHALVLMPEDLALVVSQLLERSKEPRRAIAATTTRICMNTCRSNQVKGRKSEGRKQAQRAMRVRQPGPL